MFLLYDDVKMHVNAPNVTAGGRQVVCAASADRQARAQTPELPACELTHGVAAAFDSMMQWRLRRGKRARSWMSFPPQLKRSSRWQSGRCRSRGTADGLGVKTLRLYPPHGSPQPGVSASPPASPVMTVGAISHTSVRHEREDFSRWDTKPRSERGCRNIYIFLKGASSIFVLPCWTMAERTSSGLLTMMLEPTPAVAMTLPAEVREKLAELELELSEGKKNFPTASFIMRGSYLPGPPPFTQTSRLVRRNEPATALPSHPHLELLQLVSEEGSSACDSFRNKTWSREQTCLIGSLYPDSSCTDTPMLLFEWSLSTTPELLRVSHANFLLILIENFRKMFKKHPLMKLFT